MAKQCELCDLPARLFCESDQASLCRGCDAKVHGANFLVARHSRTLLCRSCQAPTPWRASGSRLGSTVSVCNRCLGHQADVGDCGVEQEAVTRDGGVVVRTSGWTNDGGDQSGGLVEDDSEEEEEDEDDDSEEEEDEEDEDEEDNQVVPWSMEEEATPSSPPPPVASSSSSEEESSSVGADVWYGLLKRRRGSDDLPSSQDDLGCSPLQIGYLRFSAAPMAASYSARERKGDETEEDEAATHGGCSFRPLKGRRPTPARPIPGEGGVSPAGDDVFPVAHSPSDPGC